MSDAKLVNEKQKALTGHNVNYYLFEIPETENSPAVTGEVEDVIEFFNMDFSSATVFKSAIRHCKLQMDLGKPGSTFKYEAEKIFYYSQRLLVISTRNLNKMNPLFKFLVNNYNLNFPHETNFKDYYKFLDLVIEIKDPKRLSPYSFKIRDFITALDTDLSTTSIISHLLYICHLRKTSFFRFNREIIHAEILQRRSRYLLNLYNNKTTDS